MTVIAPTCHLNGTSPDVLFEQLKGAVSSLRTAQRALEEAAPNARDYYPQGPDAFTLARAAHDDRAHRLKAIQRELEAIAERVADQIDDIQAQKAGR
jgi:hypothetical protein